MRNLPRLAAPRVTESSELTLTTALKRLGHSRLAMQRSSETIGTIAAALAKAQAQLVNPEKSLVGTIRSDQASGTERSFRDAPLSSGLDIVRKALSQAER
jgi:hypothetical protein